MQRRPSDGEHRCLIPPIGDNADERRNVLRPDAERPVVDRGGLLSLVDSQAVETIERGGIGLWFNHGVSTRCACWRIPLPASRNQPHLVEKAMPAGLVTAPDGGARENQTILRPGHADI